MEGEATTAGPYQPIEYLMNRRIPRQERRRTVAVTGNDQRFSRTAVARHYAERTLRRPITRLEQELGRRLFHRIRGANGGMQRTEALRELLVDE